MASPQTRYSLDDLKRLADDGRVTEVLVGLPDMTGKLVGKQFSVEHFLRKVASEGAEMCSYVLATDVDMTSAADFKLASWETGFGDFLVMPDLETLRNLGTTRGTAVVFADPVDVAGHAVEVAPRAILRKQLDRLERLGLEARIGLEAEFMLYHGTADAAEAVGFHRLRPAWPYNLDYSGEYPENLRQFLNSLTASLRRSGRTPEACKPEGTPGQVEITFPYGPAMEACDGHVLLKHFARTVAERRGLTASFMAAPTTGVGSGLHLHVSLWQDGKPLFAEEENSTAMPEAMRHALAGLVQASSEFAPLWAPNKNSYRRFRPHSFAPTRFTWGADNRTAAFRIVGHGDGRHVESRLGGADANPYLLTASTIAAMLHGLDTRPAFPADAAAEGNSYEGCDYEMPFSLEEALEDFETSKVALQALGDTVVQHYAGAVRLELEHYEDQVPDVERVRWFLRA